MQNPATEVIDYVKDQVTHPGVTPRKTFKKNQTQLLWLLIALFTAVVCWGVMKEVKSRKRKHKAVLW